MIIFNRKITVICAVILLGLANAGAINAAPVYGDAYYDYSSGSDEKTVFGFRMGGYVFNDTLNDEWYGDEADSMSLDLTFSTANPNISWRVALDGVVSTADIYYDANNFAKSDFSMGGFSGAVMVHSDRSATTRVYAGFGMGLYGVTEEGSGLLGGSPFLIDMVGRGMGFNFFAGVEAWVGDKFAIGLEYFSRSLTIDMQDPVNTYPDTDYGGQTFLLTFNFKY